MSFFPVTAVFKERRGQRVQKTPATQVCSLKHGLFLLAMKLDGPNADQLCLEMADRLSRFLAGDSELIDEIKANARSQSTVHRVMRAATSTGPTGNAVISLNDVQGLIQTESQRMIDGAMEVAVTNMEKSVETAVARMETKSTSLVNKSTKAALAAFKEQLDELVEEACEAQFDRVEEEFRKRRRMELNDRRAEKKVKDDEAKRQAKADADKLKIEQEKTKQMENEAVTAQAQWKVSEVQAGSKKHEMESTILIEDKRIRQLELQIKLKEMEDSRKIKRRAPVDTPANRV